jgi:hypothetical protein
VESFEPWLSLIEQLDESVVQDFKRLGVLFLLSGAGQTYRFSKFCFSDSTHDGKVSEVPCKYSAETLRSFPPSELGAMRS